MQVTCRLLDVNSRDTPCPGVRSSGKSVPTLLGDGDMIKQPDQVAFVGLGYVGLCTAVTFAARGFRTTGVEVDPEKRSLIEKGHSPIHEPRLAKLLRTALRTNRFEVTGDPTDVAKADTIFITGGTPRRPDGA